MSVLLALLTGGCGGDQRERAQRSVRDGTALAQIRRQVDGQFECADLVGDPDVTVSDESTRKPGVDALVRAGVIVRRPAASRDGVRSYVDLVPAAAARKSIFYVDRSPSFSPDPYLCYGRRRVVGVRVQPARDPSAASAGDPATGSYRLQYAYRIVEAPEWVQHPEIRRVFPFVGRALGETLWSDDFAFLKQGKWAIATSRSPDRPAPLEPPIGYEAKGFDICDPEHAESLSVCS